MGRVGGRVAGSSGPFEQRPYHDDSIGRGCFTSGPANNCIRTEGNTTHESVCGQEVACKMSKRNT